MKSDLGIFLPFLRWRIKQLEHWLNQMFWSLLELVHLLLVVFAPQYLDNGVLDTKKKSTQVLGSPTTL